MRQHTLHADRRYQQESFLEQHSRYIYKLTSYQEGVSNAVAIDDQTVAVLNHSVFVSGKAYDFGECRLLTDMRSVLKLHTMYVQHTS